MKVQITLNDDLVKKIDEYAIAIGISRSALCATLIGQCVLGYDKMFEIAHDVLASDVSYLEKEKK